MISPAQTDFTIPPITNLSICVKGFVLDCPFAKSVKDVLLTFFVAIRCHILTSLCAGRQVFSSPFAHYWFCGGGFWPVDGKLFLLLFIYAPFVSFRNVEPNGQKEKNDNSQKHRKTDELRPPGTCEQTLKNYKRHLHEPCVHFIAVASRRRAKSFLTMQSLYGCA